MVDVPVATADARDPLEQPRAGRGRDRPRTDAVGRLTECRLRAARRDALAAAGAEAASVNVTGQAEDPTRC